MVYCSLIELANGILNIIFRLTITEFVDSTMWTTREDT